MGQIIGGVFVLIIALIALFVWLASRANKRRSESIREWSFRNGYNFTPGPMPALQLAPIERFEIKGETVEAEARNIASGSRMTLFDFSHATRHESGVMNNRTQYQRKITACALFKLDEPLPRFMFMSMSTAGSDSLTGKLVSSAIGLAKFVGPGRPGQLIAIDDRPGFLLHTDDDAERVQSLFREPRFFDDKCGWEVHCTGTWMLLSCKPVEPAGYDAFANLAQQIREHFTRLSS
ncbi:MAG TPA: hypothetical protein VJ901_16005 [Thermoanaerobaculia bacterium]|nr:hypothetical protein [Thermoanaerobaculia bacterium]